MGGKKRSSNPDLDPGDDLTLPLVPEELGIDPLLLAVLHSAAFLDFAGEDTADPYAATDVLDHIALYVRRLSPARMEALQDDLDKLETHAESAGWSNELIEFVGDFVDNCCSEPEDVDEDDN